MDLLAVLAFLPSDISSGFYPKYCIYEYIGATYDGRMVINMHHISLYILFLHVLAPFLAHTPEECKSHTRARTIRMRLCHIIAFSKSNQMKTFFIHGKD